MQPKEGPEFIGERASYFYGSTQVEDFFANLASKAIKEICIFGQSFNHYHQIKVLPHEDLAKQKLNSCSG